MSRPHREWQPSNVFDVFGDDHARRILVATSEQPMAADDLADLLDVSTPTVYRRANTLIDYDLLRERRQIDPDGNNYKTYEATLKRIAFEIDDGGYEIDITMRRSLVDQFDTFWSDLERSGSEPLGSIDQSGGDTSPGDPHHG